MLGLLRVRACHLLLLAVSVSLLPSPAMAEVTVQPVDSQPAFTIENPNVTDLSGLTWVGGARFWAVSDKRKALIPVTLQIDPATGKITAGEIGEPVPVDSTLGDFEGVAWVPRLQRLYVSGESGTGLRSFSESGAKGPALQLPAIFAHCRRNLAMESLTYDAARRCFWTANEETLPEDGPVAGPNQGALVRLQCSDESGRTLHQFAWSTETAPMRFYGAGNGVSDLCALPNGDLLVLERGFGGFGLHCRIFRAVLGSATDIRKIGGLAAPDAKFTKAGKELLFQQTTGLINFEGMALGPALADGWHSLVLIADSNGGSQHTFLPLRVKWTAPPRKK